MVKHLTLWPRLVPGLCALVLAGFVQAQQDVPFNNGAPVAPQGLVVPTLPEGPGTGQLQRILFNKDMEELRRETLLAGLRQPIRDVRQGPDGYLYVLTDEQDGAVLRIRPAD